MKSQTGRSMVEMLDVLAIIGVLSVGGIAGYRIAMEKYKINEVINAYNLLLVEALPQLEKCNNFTVSIQNMDGDVSCEDYSSMGGSITWTVRLDTTNMNLAKSRKNLQEIIIGLMPFANNIYDGFNGYCSIGGTYIDFNSTEIPDDFSENGDITFISCLGMK